MHHRHGRARLVRTGSYLVLAAAALLAAPPAGAEEAAPKAAGAAAPASVEEVVVTSRRMFLSADTSGATNLPIPIEKVPQSISLVSADFLDVADLKTLGQVADYTPGAIQAGNPEGFASVVKLRGFAAGKSIDGLNISTGSYEHDYAIYDRMEFVKGPSSVIYGVSSPGGLVNFVTKGAGASTPDYVSAQIGSWSNYRLEGQAARALDSEGRTRAIVNLVRDAGDGFINKTEHEVTSIYGGLDTVLTDTVTAYAHGGYVHNVRTAFDGIPTLPDGSPAPVSRSFFIGSPDAKLTTDVYYLSSGVNWRATPMLDVNLKANYQDTRSDGLAPYALALQPNGDLLMTAQAYKRHDTRDIGLSATSVYRLDDLGLTGSFVSLAALYQETQLRDQQQPYLFNGQVAARGNIFAGEDALSRLFESGVYGTPDPLNQNTTRTLTLSGQSVIKLTDKLSALVGASWSRPRAVVAVGSVETKYNFESQTSYRVGLTYEVTPQTNAYLSFSQSFNPQQFQDVNGAVLPPLIGEQYEAGVKYRTANGRLLLSGAVYQITQENEAQYAATVNNFDRFRALGEVRHRGVELQALGRLTPQWEISAGYAYLDAEVTRDANQAIVGAQRLFLPEHTASLFTTYAFDGGRLDGWSFGGGGRYVSAERTSYDRSTRDIPGYFLVDAVVSYRIDDVTVQLNVRNLFDKRYFTNNYNTLVYGNTPGEPTNVSLSVKWAFGPRKSSR
ncbi:TonB-dependent siderophore receptor [Caulobacter sp. CCUG 60055]|uniref:TonB-dependent siderophore receptor n=3 Tax=Pseudomonadota TaxID=1224 RepID=UPI001FA7E074|nr:TonB-dependent siderophore receptor [Caulobacter sp. CCUG 60055]MBQ1540669.1 TonB-dependent siderophore receptor [Caulobacteraceae bacterium]MCI3178912.1 TonB-dependent siderophore receptor [Caulobacter sp. CCUG 60055]